MASVRSINNPDPIAICLDFQCSANVVTNVHSRGTIRFLNVVGNYGVQASLVPAAANLAGNAGVFYTNPFGKQLVTAGSAEGVPSWAGADGATPPLSAIRM